MKQTSLEHFTTELSTIWGPLNSTLTQKSKALLEDLSRSCIAESWVEELMERNAPVTELYRDPEHGFILMAHIEQKGEKSPPHDHGNGWVIYATVLGRTEMGHYNQLLHPDGTTKLVQKDCYEQGPGDCQVYLPGDIHDTHTLENHTLMLRLTSCDFLKELQEGRLIRYQTHTAQW